MSTPLDTTPDATRDRTGTTTTSGGVARPGAVLTWVLRGNRRSLLGWALAIAAVSGFYASFADLLDASEMESLIATMPDGLATALGYDRLGSDTGFLTSTVYGLLGPILLLVFGIGQGARLIGGLEEDGALELELSAAIDRRRVVVERHLALLVQLALLIVALTFAVLVTVVAMDLDVALRGVLAGGLGLWLLAAAISSVAFAAGAASGRRAAGLAVGSGVAVVAYLADAAADLVVDGAWLEALSPFSWYLANEPLDAGLAPAGVVGLVALTVVAAVVAVATFERRDLGA